MAISIVNGNRGTATEKTADANLTLAPSANLAAGNYGLLAVVVDNVVTSEGETNAISVTDDQGNTWTKLREQTEGAGGAGTGVSCALFLARLPNGLTTGATITVALTANATAKGAGLAELSCAAGFEIVPSSGGANGFNGTATSYSAALSGLTNVAGLYVGLAACEDELDTACTLDAAYTALAFGSIGSGTAGANATNVRARVATLANTSTGDTFDRTGLTTGDKAAILVRLEEQASAVTETPTPGGAGAGGTGPGGAAAASASGAAAGGPASGARGSADTGGAAAQGTGPTAAAAATPGGATAGGVSPVEPVFETPTPGGASAGGAGPAATVPLSVPSGPTLLDDGNRANENPLANGWARLGPAEDPLRLVSNRFTGTAETISASYLASAGTFTDCEASVTVAVSGDANEPIAVLARLVDVGSANWGGYGVSYDANTTVLRLRRFTNGAPADIATGTVPFRQDGDKIKIRCDGSTIEAWHWRDGTWSLICSTTDATYASGHLGLYIVGDTGAADDFFGGTLAADVRHAVAAGTAPTGRAACAPGGAVAGGVAPAAPEFETPTPGGAAAGGVAAAAAVPGTGGSASAGGASPAGRTDIASGGAAATGNAPTGSAAVPSGAGAAVGNGPAARTDLAPGGALAGGFEPTDSFPVSQTPPPGGAIAAGTGPTARVTFAPGGATAAGTGPTTLAPAAAGGATSAAVTPSTSSPLPAAIALADGTRPAAVAEAAGGGATGGGAPPFPSVAAAPAAAIAGGPPPTGAATLIPAGAAVAGGVAPAEPIFHIQLPGEPQAALVMVVRPSAGTSRIVAAGRAQRLSPEADTRPVRPSG